MTPVTFTDATFIAVVPEGAQMIAIGERVMVVSPGMAPHWITPTGLVPLAMNNYTASHCEFTGTKP